MRLTYKLRKPINRTDMNTEENQDDKDYCKLCECILSEYEDDVCMWCEEITELNNNLSETPPNK